MSGELVFVVRTLWWSCTEYTLSCEIWQWIVLILYLFCIALRFPRSSKTESWDHLYNVLLISCGIACRFSKMTSKRSHLSSWDQKQNVSDCEYQGNWIGLRFRTHWMLGHILSFSSSLWHLNHRTHVVPGGKFTVWKSWGNGKDIIMVDLVPLNSVWSQRRERKNGTLSPTCLLQ